jgi:maltose alpha-D-glucosyltransferase/alpha-amylase
VRWFALIGRRLAEIHKALAGAPGEAFQPEPFTTHYRRSLVQAFRSHAVRALALLREQLQHPVLVHVRPQGLALVERLPDIFQGFRAIERYRAPMLRIRCHNDLSLEHVLLTGDDLRVIDWEGDPTKPLTARRIKRSALRDLARLDQALAVVATAGAARWQAEFGATGEKAAQAESWAQAWQQASVASLLDGYRKGVAGLGLVPEDDAEFAATYGAFRLSAAVEELMTCVERERYDQLPAVLANLAAQVK